MPTKTSKPDVSLVRAAATWPTIREVADEYGVPWRWVKSLAERRKLRTYVLDKVRIDPEDWEDFLARRYRPADD